MIEFKLKQFPTHLKTTNPKKAKPKFSKINGQLIYNSNVNRFARNTLMTELHKYVMKRIPKKLKVEKFPIKVKIILRTVINHASIQRRNEKITWKYPSEEYVPTSDLDNMIVIWSKGILDCIVKSDIIPDDTIQYITNIEYEYQQVDDLEDREIIVQISEL